MIGDVIHMRHAMVLHVGVEILSDMEEAITIATGKPEKFQLLCGGGIREQFV